jgi:hypothetical protein
MWLVLDVISCILLVWPSVILASHGFSLTDYVALGLFLLLVGVVQGSRGRAVRVGVFLGATTFS